MKSLNLLKGTGLIKQKVINFLVAECNQSEMKGLQNELENASKG